MKRHFACLHTKPHYNVETQTKVIVACCIIHNHIIEVDPNDNLEDRNAEEDGHGEMPHEEIEALGGTKAWTNFRDNLCENMCLDLCYDYGVMARYYVVFVGRVLRVYETWEEAHPQVSKFRGAEVNSRAEADCLFTALVEKEKNVQGGVPLEEEEAPPVVEDEEAEDVTDLGRMAMRDVHGCIFFLILAYVEVVYYKSRYYKSYWVKWDDTPTGSNNNKKKERRKKGVSVVVVGVESVSLSPVRVDESVEVVQSEKGYSIYYIYTLFWRKVKGCPPQKILVQVKGLFTTKAGRPLRHNSSPDLDHEPEYRGYPKINGREIDPRRFGPLVDDDDVPQSKDSFKTICTDVLPSNEPSIPQSNVHLSNEPVLTNVHQSNEYFQTIPTDIYATRLVSSALFRVSTYCPVHTCIQVETEGGNTYKAGSSRWVAFIIKQKLRKDPNYKPSRIINDMQIHHNIDVTYNLAWRAKEKAHAEMRYSFEHAYQLLMGYSAELRYGVAYTNHAESWNNVILKVRDFHIHVFIKELCKIYSKMSYTYRKEAEKSQARLTPWSTNHCESRKFVADSLTCRVCTSRHHFQMTRYGRTDSINIEDGACSCRWWQTMGIPCENEVRALGLANVDPTARVSEYITNDTYKVVYEPIWIPIRRIEQWKI
ncbi:hypothetical protein GIB67_012503 [Kingdonia uniflora]|uniref:Ribonuclease H1 N-terminal domain-containing protein n=1 Tax=Kingdonia uniflora TaxID=39325 RepID=A0A7J7MVR0_9MAGN|nr:hypothetical protein GIB67_012503 [Kingdonia uniflora]